MLLGDGHIGYPKTSFRVVGTDAQRLEFMTLSFLGMTVEYLGKTNLCMGGSQVRIQRQRPLTFGSALGPALALDEHSA